MTSVQELIKWMSMYPNAGLKELAEMIGDRPVDVARTCGCHRLEPRIRHDVDVGKIPLCSAYCLTKLSQQLQLKYHFDALGMPTKDFVKFIKPIILKEKKQNASSITEER